MIRWWQCVFLSSEPVWGLLERTHRYFGSQYLCQRWRISVPVFCYVVWALQACARMCQCKHCLKKYFVNILVHFVLCKSTTWWQLRGGQGRKPKGSTEAAWAGAEQWVTVVAIQQQPAAQDAGRSSVEAALGWSGQWGHGTRSCSSCGLPAPPQAQECRKSLGNHLLRWGLPFCSHHCPTHSCWPPALKGLCSLRRLYFYSWSDSVCIFCSKSLW